MTAIVVTARLIVNVSAATDTIFCITGSAHIDTLRGSTDGVYMHQREAGTSNDEVRFKQFARTSNDDDDGDDDDPAARPQGHASRATNHQLMDDERWK
jgi:hypothetical protein